MMCLYVSGGVAECVPRQGVGGGGATTTAAGRHQRLRLASQRDQTSNSYMRISSPNLTVKSSLST